MTVFFMCLLMLRLQAQIVINEGSNKNGSQIADEDSDFEDWIELYNAGPEIMNLSNYAITDDSLEITKWIFPPVNLPPNNFLILYASGKDRKPTYAIHHYEMAVKDTATWRYNIPDASTASDWAEESFDASLWATGLTSVGYGDTDDSTIVADGTISVFLRNTFEITDTSKIADAFLHIDYDDGFVAYLNGNVIAMNGFLSGAPGYDALSGVDHEAGMYAGYAPEQFIIDEATLKTFITEGTNVLAVEIHNTNPGSSDLTVRPFLSFGIKDATILWDMSLPVWYTVPVSSSNLHTNFKIANEGEKIFLSNAAGDIIDDLIIDDLDIDYSIGRKTDGNDTTGIFITATPGYSNNGYPVFDSYVGEPHFILNAGFYTGDQSIVIIPPGTGVDIYYTLNGEIPTTDDYLYTSSLIINATTVVKARCFDTDNILLPGKTITNTYFINEEISMPVISISTDNDNLYGDEGIYDNWWTDWKRPCYIEYFDSIHVNAFEQNSGIKIDGGAGGSRSNAQKSFRIEPDHNTFGDGVLHYPIIPRKSYINDYETFYLRNGSNMFNVLPYKDACMVRTTEGTYNEHMAYTPVVVFLNGEYWGFYELREKLDEGHFKYTQEIEKEDLDLLSCSYWYGSILRTLSGSDSDFISMRDYLQYYPTPADSDFYYIADSILDLKNFTDYLIAETWFANTDWPWNNMKVWRDRGGDNKWKYAVIDVEWGLGYSAWTNAYTDMMGYIMYPQQFIEPAATLMQNPIYHDYLINRYADLMNTTFLPERTLAMEDSIYEEILPELPRQWQKWGWGSLTYHAETFNDYRTGLRDDFELRSEQVRNHIQYNYALDGQVELTLDVFPPEAGRIRISTLTIYDMPWSGIYFDGVPVKITAEENTGFTFEHWGENDFIADTLLATFLNNISSDQTFTAYFSGEAAAENIAISEINYNSESTVASGNWLELFNYGAAGVNISGWKIQDANPLHNYTIPDGIILNAGERIVFTDDDSAFTVQNPTVTNYLGELGFGLDNTSETIKLFDHQGHLKLSITYVDSLPWPSGADGEGRTLELENPLADLNDPGNWFDGCIGGSPGAAYSPCDFGIIISEINYHSIDTAESGDWVELRNISGSEINIGNWKFVTDSAGIENEFMIPDGRVLLPGSNWALLQNEFAFNAIHPAITNYDASFDFNLDNGGEWIRFYNELGKLCLSVHYNDKDGWPEAADGDGYTLEVIDSLGLMNASENWTIICPQGSPGMYAFTPCYDTTIIDTTDLVLLNEGLFISLYPNPVNNFAIIELKSLSSENIFIDLVNMHGEILENVFSGKINSGENKMILNTKDLTSGIYFVVITAEQGRSLLKFVRE
ncbi:MAG: lamin tail domain-containing protein [Chitinophagales bacterium]|nr:lamin tail domain-containing protein [Chitinophagales bacterium]